MFCKKCGRQAEPNQKFCAGCGNNLQDNSQVYNQNQQPMYNQQPVQQINQKQKNKFPKWATVAITVSGIFLLLAVGFVFKVCYDGCEYFTNDCYPSQC